MQIPPVQSFLLTGQAQTRLTNWRTGPPQWNIALYPIEQAEIAKKKQKIKNKLKDKSLYPLRSRLSPPPTPRSGKSASLYTKKIIILIMYPFWNTLQDVRLTIIITHIKEVLSCLKQI